MIVEERIYRVKPGAAATYIETYEREGLAIQTKHLGKLFGYFTTEVGPLNTIIHMWQYESMDERTRRRAALQADPEWRAIVDKLRPLIETQENRILIPTRFCPLR